MAATLDELRTQWKAQLAALREAYGDDAVQPMPEPYDRCLSAGVDFAYVGVAATCHHPMLERPVA